MQLKKEVVAKILARMGFRKARQADGTMDYDPKLYLLVEVLGEVHEDHYSKLLDGIADKLDAHLERIKALRRNSLANNRRTLGRMKTVIPDKPSVTVIDNLLEHRK